MGRFVYWMNVSLDLLIEHRADEDGGGDWLRIDERLHREFNKRADRLTVLVQGRRIFEIMEDFWPAASEDPTMPEHVREYGRIWMTKPKILVSDTRTTNAPNTTTIGGSDTIGRLQALREQTQGDIGVGGATLATHLLEARLLDELLLFTHPSILGSGRPLFDRSIDPIELELIEQARYGQVTLHRYAVRSALPCKHPPTD